MAKKKKGNKGSKSYVPKKLPKITFAPIKTVNGINVKSPKVSDLVQAVEVAKPVIEQPKRQKAKKPDFTNAFGLTITGEEYAKFEDLVKKYNAKSKREFKNQMNSEIIIDGVTYKQKDLPEKSAYRFQGKGPNGDHYKSPQSIYQLENMRTRSGFEKEIAKMEAFLDRNWKLNSQYRLRENQIKAIKNNYANSPQAKELVRQLEKMPISKYMKYATKIDGASLEAYYSVVDLDVRLKQIYEAFDLGTIELDVEAPSEQQSIFQQNAHLFDTRNI